jgi:hypothetical protein
MGIMSFLFIVCLIFIFAFFIIETIIEDKIEDSHPFKKWWRKHIVDEYPYEDDDNF